MVLYYILLPLAWIVFHIGFRVECIGRENLKKVRTNGCIIAPNHVSAIDRSEEHTSELQSLV